MTQLPHFPSSSSHATSPDPAPTHPPHAQHPCQPHPPHPRAPLPASTSSPSSFPQPLHDPLTLALQTHHRSLVSHYWQYAQQGYSAPLTAPLGSEERERQNTARREAVEWARACGIAVREADGEHVQREPTGSLSSSVSSGLHQSLGRAPLPEPPTRSGTSPSPSTESSRERAVSRPPLPVAPSGATAPPPVPSSIHSPHSSLHSHPSRPTLPPHPHPHPHTPQQALGRSVSLANPAITAHTTVLPRSVSEAIPRPPPSETSMQAQSQSQSKRPLPVPPIAPAVPSSSVSSSSSAWAAGNALADSLGRISISSNAPSPVPAVPSISLPSIVTGGSGSRPSSPSPSPSPAATTIPTFSFPDSPSTSPVSSAPPPPPSPAPPSFSFSLNDDDNNDHKNNKTDEAPPSPAPAKPRLHPRYDPTHPSHTLYHPTSVSSPLPPPSSLSSLTSPSQTQTLAQIPESGTLICTSCHTPIYGRVLLALERKWHPGCFRCAERGCGVGLEVMEFEGTPGDCESGSGSGSGSEEEDGEGDGEEDGEVRDGWESSEEEGEGEEAEGWVKTRKPGQQEGKKERKERKESLKGKAWCMVHFEERFALYCHHCHTPISGADYLPITDPLLPPSSSSSSSSSSLTSSASSESRKSKSKKGQTRTRTRYYHPLHFFCSGCGDPFIDPVLFEKSHSHSHSNPLAQQHAAAELEVKPYFAHSGHPYCNECELRIYRPKCPGCRGGIWEEEGFLEVPVSSISKVSKGKKDQEGEEGEEGGGGKGEDEGEEKQMWHVECFKCTRCQTPLSSHYLLRLESTLVPLTRKQGGGFEEVVEERPYCRECYDL